MQNALFLNKSTSKKYNLLDNILIILICFPFTLILPIKTDLQLNALVFSAIYILVGCTRFKIDKNVKILIATVILAFAIFIYSGLSFEAARSAGNYMNVLIVSYATFELFRKKGFKENLFKSIIAIWFVAGLLQVIVDKNLFTWFVSEARTTDNRGVISFATEPSFYGIAMSFMIFFVKDFNKHKFVFVFMIICQVVFFAQSSFGVIVLVGFLLMTIIGEVESKKLIFMIFLSSILIGTIIVLVLIWTAPDSRMVYLIKNVFNVELYKDVSIVSRLNAITFSFKSLIENNFMPNGFNRRIMSGFGQVFYDLGIFGLPAIIVVCCAAANSFKIKKVCWLNSIIFFIVMLGAIQLSHPMLGMLVGYGWSVKYKSYMSINSKPNKKFV